MTNLSELKKNLAAVKSEVNRVYNPQKIIIQMVDPETGKVYEEWEVGGGEKQA